MRLARGSIWFVEIPGVGDRPALVVSWQPVQQALGAAIVARITSIDKQRTLPTAVRLGAGEAGLDRPGFVLCHDLFTIEESSFRRESGLLSAGRLIEIEGALKRALDLH